MCGVWVVGQSCVKGVKGVKVWGVLYGVGDVEIVVRILRSELKSAANKEESKLIQRPCEPSPNPSPNPSHTHVHTRQHHTPLGIYHLFLDTSPLHPTTLLLTICVDREGTDADSEV